jgi:hypothetical protein
MIEYKELCEKLNSLAPGSKIENEGIIWVRMRDSISHHLEGYLLNTSNGEYFHYSRVANKLHNTFKII